MDFPSYERLPEVMFTAAAVLRKMQMHTHAIAYVKHLLAHSRPKQYPEHELLLQLGWTWQQHALKLRTEYARKRRKTHTEQLVAAIDKAEEEAASAFRAAFRLMQDQAREEVGTDAYKAQQKAMRKSRRRMSVKSRWMAVRAAKADNVLQYKTWKEWRYDSAAWLKRGLRYSTQGDDMFAVRCMGCVG